MVMQTHVQHSKNKVWLQWICDSNACILIKQSNMTRPETMSTWLAFAPTQMSRYWIPLGAMRASWYWGQGKPVVQHELVRLGQRWLQQPMQWGACPWCFFSTLYVLVAGCWMIAKYRSQLESVGTLWYFETFRPEVDLCAVPRYKRRGGS